MIIRFSISLGVALFILTHTAGCGSTSEAEHVCQVHTVVPGVLIRGCQPDERGLFLAYCHARLRCLVAGEKELQLDAAGVSAALE